MPRDARLALEFAGQFVVNAPDRLDRLRGRRESFRHLGHFPGANRLVAQQRDERPLAGRLDGALEFRGAVDEQSAN